MAHADGRTVGRHHWQVYFGDYGTKGPPFPGAHASMNHGGYVVQNPFYASWDMGGARRLNGKPFTADEISDSKEQVTLRIPIQSHH